MFDNPICDTPFTTKESDSFFKNIVGDCYLGDISFIATLRALLFSRMNSEDFIRVVYKKCSDNIIFWKNTIAIYDNAYIYYPSGSNVIKIDKITEFYRGKFDVDVYIKPDMKAVCAIVKNLDLKKLHYLQCSILSMLPWYFNPDEGVSKIEMNLIQSLFNRSDKEYLNCLDELAKQYDFRSAYIKELLADFDTTWERNEITKISREIDELNKTIRIYNDAISDYFGQKNEKLVMLSGLQNKINADNEQIIMNYFLCNKALSLQSVSDSTVIFLVKTTLEYFDKEYASTIIDNENSILYGYGVSREDEKRIYEAIFLDEKIKLRLCACFEFNINGNIHAMNSLSYGKEFNTYMPNPHLDIYRCLGGNEVVINELLNDRDYVGAIEQCVVSTGNLNLSDNIVMEQFAMILFTGNSYHGMSNNKCLELPDGSIVDYKEALEWLNSQEVLS